MLPAARRTRLPLRLFGILTSLLCLLACGSPPLPDIVLVTFDTLRQDRVGAYGSKLDLTPHLDALAERGLVYDAAFTTMPTTVPAHWSLFTGQYPFQHGVRFNAEFAAMYTGQPRDLVARLRERGYTTSCFITAPLFGRAGDSLGGFLHSDLPDGALRSGVDAARAASAWLSVKQEGPAFLWLHLYDAHAPYGSAEEKAADFPVDLERHGWIGSSEFTPRVRGEMIRRYEQGVRDADRAFGSLIAAIGDRIDDVLLIAVADHGEYLDERLSIGYAWGHGALLGEEVLRIPLMIAGPGVKSGRSATAVSIRDLYTTILEAAQVGDGAALAEGRVDLRTPPSGRRIVSAERRSYANPERMLSLWGPTVWGRVRDNAFAAMDGDDLVVLGEFAGEDGGTSPGDLAATARRYREESLTHRPAPSTQDIDDESREMLRRLGYLD